MRKHPISVLQILAAICLLSSSLGRPVAQSRAQALGASETVTVGVPAGMRSAPFDVQRTLTIPRGYTISVYARVPQARFMAVTPDGNLLVSDNASAIYLVRSSGGGNVLVTDFATGMNGPQGMAFHAIGKTTYLYVGERNQIDRFPWHKGDITAENGQVIISGLPYGPTADGDAHPMKDVAFGADGKLYVNISSSCNVCTDDATSNPVRGSIYQYNANGTGGKLFARGLRNAEGLAFVPGTNTLWAAVNERDNIAYPFDDSTGNYGKVVQAYVDNHPPDELTAVKQGANYGWPFCNPDPDTRSGYDNMPFDPDYQFNQQSRVVSCSGMQRISKGIPAHSAPLGLTFLQGTKAPSGLRSGAIVALHGSWNRSSKGGYKVAYFPWLRDNGPGHPGAQQDLVTGWLNISSQSAWDRPVDVVVDPHGDLLITGDAGDTIYRLSHR